MSSPCRVRAERLLALLLAAAVLAGCEREKRHIGPSGPEAAPVIQTTPFVPGGAQPLPKDPRAEFYENNAFEVAQGARLFRWYNCSGCHSNGGGGMGPALIDDQWIYGSEIEQIYGTIQQGRPNGMPSFRDKATEEQIWQLAAYVRSLAGKNSQVASSRSDAMAGIPPRNQASPADAGKETPPKRLR
ncbi:c-type cytochrome [Caulobacter sp. 17J80-11]|uniref:c-type cytochrome n=1 Tax=Caulobacter sp. 17J80-11 TaxID=2763502 RepID=UPI001653BE30|nr:c-type cytochrome [Caulobacter sp. 17J80-11]MBC6982565.1 cytochrome c [Caulobacter sp. 17J80-11]